MLPSRWFGFRIDAWILAQGDFGVSCQGVRAACFSKEIGRGGLGLEYERSLLGDFIYAKVTEIDTQRFDQRSREYV